MQFSKNIFVRILAWRLLLVSKKSICGLESAEGGKFLFQQKNTADYLLLYSFFSKVKVYVISRVFFVFT